MGEVKKAGKVVLRAVDSRKAAGVCTYSAGKDGIEVTVSAQLFSGGRPSAVLQHGAEREYLCRPPADIAAPIRSREPGVMAVWVLDDGEPALFGQLFPGAFDREAARRRLPGKERDTHGKTKDMAVKAAAIPMPAPAARKPGPSPREPSGEDMEVPFQSLLRQAGEDTPLLLLQPGEVEESLPIAAAAVSAPVPKPDASPAETAVPKTIGPVGAERAKKPPAQPWSPLIVKRAPRQAPRSPVYSPLWDDISSELEKMLETLPRANPFSGGGGTDAEFAEVPMDDAVQCYVGSVTVNGLKVFLQAVPARPYARPAGFDHTLVARSGECYWVKYFIQDS